MNDECCICGAKLQYQIEESIMRCAVCNKKEPSNACCENGHYVCNECHTSGMDAIVGLCLEEKSKNPIRILEKMMRMPFCHMHGPEHHTLVGVALLTAYKNAGGNIQLEYALPQMLNRGKNVPGGVCGFWGACGAGISSGIFISIITQASPLSANPLGLSNLMTSKSLFAIGNVGGPRCCKRDSYLSTLSAIAFVKEHFTIAMAKSKIKCTYSEQNNQCIQKRCPFYNKENTK